jgi:hypothetical protein
VSGSILEVVTGAGFVPGSIHKEHYRKFWKETLKANKWVLSTLKSGYILPLASKPPAYEEENNASARNNMSFVQTEVEKLQRQGVIRIVQEKPHCVSPLTVAERRLADGSIKRRLCWDGSRLINPLLDKDKVVLSHLQSALEITSQGDFQCKYDLKAAFHHIKIFKDHVDYLGAAYIDKNGKRIYFVFLFLPFGASSAVHCLTKIFKPVCAYLHSLGIRHTVYIDDGRVVAASREKAIKDFQKTLEVLKSAGWIIEITKTNSPERADQAMEYLGFIIDSVRMTVHLTPEKRASLQKSLEEIISFERRYMSAKTLASGLGRMISAEPALGSFPLIHARAAYADLEQAVNQHGWKASLQLSDASISAIKEFLQNISEYDGAPIKSTHTSISVVSIIGEPSNYLKTKVIPNHVIEKNIEVWCSDASAVAVCAYSVQANEAVYFIDKLTAEELSLSSGHRELLAVKKSLHAQLTAKGPWDLPITLYWMTDSSNLVAFLSKGSGKHKIQADVLEVLCLAKKLNCRLIPIHLLRGDPRIQLADAGSKAPDSDDWGIDEQTFSTLEQKYGPFSVDLFADESNHRTEKFFSDFLSPSSAGVNAFAHSWDNENCYACPPVNLILKTIRKLLTSKCRGVLVIPKWTTAKFWPFAFPDGSNPISIFSEIEEIHPIIIQNQRARSPLAGQTSFSFLVLHFNLI